MDLSSFDLEGLQSLHLSYHRILENHINKLEELNKNNNSDDKLLRELMEIKIEQFRIQISAIEDRINALNNQKLRFSVEYMKWHFGVFKKAVQIHFLPTSNAFKTYGGYITGTVLIDEDDPEGLMQAIREGKNSDGIIKFDETVSDEMPGDIKEKLRTIGFYASEIITIY
ncbi:hypothetical protein [uncultured Pedobacter sp.]|uniref:hypothetical protein n=1 Tax=uncultured Pedobacter sp. TaxID=246139 RepID=UPI0025E84F5D|nr:hypothetical protein [uncultured Pedobacter sp.]